MSGAAGVRLTAETLNKSIEETVGKIKDTVECNKGVQTALGMLLGIAAETLKATRPYLIKSAENKAIISDSNVIIEMKDAIGTFDDIKDEDIKAAVKAKLIKQIERI